jgi:hypothetical protein
MNAYIHQNSFFESNDEPLDEKAKWEDSLVARHVLAKIDASTNIAEVTERLPFSRFKIYRAISELLSHRLILAPDARSAGLSGRDLVRDAVEKTPVPV